MSTSTTQPANDTHEAPFLAPETHQRADEAKAEPTFRDLAADAGVLCHCITTEQATAASVDGSEQQIFSTKGPAVNTSIVHASNSINENLIDSPWADYAPWVREIKIEAAHAGRQVFFPNDAPDDLKALAARNNFRKPR